MTKYARTQTPVKVEAADARKARRLPMPGPGIKVRIPLLLLPAYLELYRLDPIDGQAFPPLGPPPVLLVKWTGKPGKQEQTA